MVSPHLNSFEIDPFLIFNSKQLINRDIWNMQVEKKLCHSPVMLKSVPSDSEMRDHRVGLRNTGGSMKSYRKELWFEVPTRRAFINITGDVQECIDDSSIREGLILVNAMHITASVFINDDESGLHHDYEIWLEKLAPHEPVSGYRHNVGEDNADAHMKRQIMGREVVVAITRGRLDFGTWEQIFYGEFDGRRKKRVLVKIIGE
jgi:secondary thiamine-phosphate synthase enzyme